MIRSRLAILLLVLALLCTGAVAETHIYEDAGPQPGAPASAVYVQPIPDLPDSFLRGMDISSVLSQEESGVTWRDESGAETDLFALLASAGIDTVRVRVWNDPYDAQGHGYGGGNCDAARAGTIGARAAAQGMRTLVDFHYSDFWADPNKQMAPKAWQGLSLKEKGEALYAYTVESLNAILDAGAEVSIVQIGNEINTGMAGESTDVAVIQLLKQGAAAVREVSAQRGLSIRVAVHFTGVDGPDFIRQKSLWLKQKSLDYDIFGLSYYPYWHGSLTNLEKVIAQLREDTGKEVMILETAFPYTPEDGDASGNSVGGAEAIGNYFVDVQGQTQAVRDVFAAAWEAGATGVFYWEGAWTPVGSEYTANQALWEQYGSGWASSYAAEYDPEDAGQYYGGSSWDNQAFFAFDGTALPSLQLFRTLTTGTLSDRGPVYAQDPQAIVQTEVEGNLIINGSFEDEDMSMWTVLLPGEVNPTDRQTKSADAHTGDNAFHFWHANEVAFQVEQAVEIPGSGTWTASAFLQGGDVGPEAEIYFYVRRGEELLRSEDIALEGWVKWKEPRLTFTTTGAEVVTIGVSVRCAPGGWGTIDDVTLLAGE